MARSAAGSSILRPPTTLTNTSCSARCRFRRRVSTAVIISRRFRSTPLGVRRALPNCVGLVSPWTSTSSGRVPSIVTAIADPAALTMRSARKASDGLVTSTRPALEHLEHAHLGGRAEAVLDRPQQAVGLEAVAFQVEHRIDDVLQHARPGDGALLGHVPDDEHRHAARLGQLAQPRGALAHLRDRPGRRLHLRHVNGLDRVDDQQSRLDRL